MTWKPVNTDFCVKGNIKNIWNIIVKSIDLYMLKSYNYIMKIETYRPHEEFIINNFKM